MYAGSHSSHGSLVGPHWTLCAMVSRVHQAACALSIAIPIIFTSSLQQDSLRKDLCDLQALNEIFKNLPIHLDKLRTIVPERLIIGRKVDVGIPEDVIAVITIQTLTPDRLCGSSSHALTPSWLKTVATSSGSWAKSIEMCFTWAGSSPKPAAGRRESV